MLSTAVKVVFLLHIQKKSIRSLEAKCNYNVNMAVVCVVLVQKCVASNRNGYFRHVFIEMFLMDVQ